MGGHEMKRFSIALWTLMIASLLVGCGSSGTPEEAAREWLQAQLDLDGNALAATTCAAQQSSVQTAAVWTSALSILGKEFIGEQMKGDGSDLHFEAFGEAGQSAQVRVTGDLRVAVLLVSQTLQVDERWLMVRERGEWKWCGYAEPPKTQLAIPFLSRTVVPPPPKVQVQETREAPQPTPLLQAWRIIPIAVSEEQELAGITAEPGWKFVVLYFAVENMTDQPLAFTLQGDYVKSVRLTTSEGYEYSLSSQSSWLRELFGTGGHLIPGGFRVRQVHLEGNRPVGLVFSVAQNTSGYQLTIPGYAPIDFERDREEVVFPSDRSASQYHLLGDTVLVPEKGSIQVTGFRKHWLDTHGEATAVIDVTYENASGGYDVLFDVEYAVVGDDGVLAVELNRDPVKVGPAQRAEVQHELRISNARELVLLVSGDVTAAYSLRSADTGADAAPVLADVRLLWNSDIEVGSTQVAYSPDGTTLALGGPSGIVLYEAGTLEALRAIESDDELVNLSWSADGQSVIGISDHGVVGSWRVSDGTQAASFKGYDGRLRGSAFSDRGEIVALWGVDSTEIRVWSVSDRQELQRLDAQQFDWDELYGGALSEDGGLLATGCERMREQHVCLWDVTSGQLLHNVSVDGRTAETLAFSPDGTLLAAGMGVHASDVVMVWPLSDWGLGRTFYEGWPVTSLAFSPDVDLSG